jgi:hypothetical protein
VPARAEDLSREAEESRNPNKGSDDAMERCTELEADLAELRAAYDQYFQGVDRLPPLKRHEAFKKSVARLKGSFVRQTAAKFRIESISQKFLTYERLWDRTIKEIENGTYKRDLARLKRRGGPEKRKSADTAFDIEEDLDISDMDEGADDLSSAIAAAEAAVTAKPVPPIAPAVPVIKPLVPGSAPVAAVAPATKAVTPAIAPGKTGVVAPLAPAIPAVKTSVVPAITAALTPPAGKPVISPAGTLVAAAKPAGATGSNPATRPVSGSSPALKPSATQMTQASRPPNAGGNEGLSDTKIKAIYDAYVMAKKRCGEDTRQVTYDSVASTLKKQVPELMRAHNAKSVEFKVVIKDGKAVLRALPKEE